MMGTICIICGAVPKTPDVTNGVENPREVGSMRDEAWETREERVLGRARELEADFIRIHGTLSILKDKGKERQGNMRNLLIRHLEDREDGIIRELGELIECLSSPPAEPPQRMLRLAGRDKGRCIE